MKVFGAGFPENFPTTRRFYDRFELLRRDHMNTLSAIAAIARAGGPWPIAGSARALRSRSPLRRTLALRAA
jgi:hypothetical protein